MRLPVHLPVDDACPLVAQSLLLVRRCCCRLRRACADRRRGRARSSIGDSDERIAAINKAAVARRSAGAGFFQALLDNEVRFTGDRVFIVRDDKAVDAATGATVTLPADAEDVINNNRISRRDQGRASRR